MSSFCNEPPPQPPPKKKFRTSPQSWKIFPTESIGPEGKLFGLQELFARGAESPPVSGDTTQRRAHSSHTGSGPPLAVPKKDDPFYTFRLEHRQGGPLAQFRGEERILLFRSDRPGAVAKIIFSSSHDETFSKSLKQPLPVSDTQSISEAATSPTPTARAKIHVLDVKAPYRGRDLGGLLFSEAITSLKSKYCNDDEDTEERNAEIEDPGENRIKRKQIYDVECELDAEEDLSRHGKLVEFYEHLGCRVKHSNRVQYLNNNDGETYRKVPMKIDLHPPRVDCPTKQERARQRRKKISHLLSSKGSFLPVKLVGPQGKLSVRPFARQDELTLDWLVTESPEGIQFRTTHGHLLIVSPNGSAAILAPDQDDDASDLDICADELNKWSRFVPCHIPDRDKGENDSASSRGSSGIKDLWFLRTAHGTFLTADSLNHTLSCSKLPSFWQANGTNLSLVCTSDTPPRRHHYRKGWKFQTHEYVLSMRRRFLNFSLGRATIAEALGWLHAYPAHPFHVWSCDDSSSGGAPSLRTLCFYMAEAARQEGLPDWVQLVALIHELGEAVKTLDPSHTGEMAESLYDWTISSRSRIVGVKAPQRASFHEFRHLNMDEDDSRYNTSTGVYNANCGLDNVLLMWSGSEYVYSLLIHNEVTLPEEALAMIRYFSLGDWHEHNEYGALTNDFDSDIMPFVAEFDALRRRVRLECADCNDLTDEQCSFLWDNYYATIAAKYGCSHALQW